MRDWCEIGPQLNRIVFAVNQPSPRRAPLVNQVCLFIFKLIYICAQAVGNRAVVETISLFK
jgi:hypothetical protein